MKHEIILTLFLKFFTLSTCNETPRVRLPLGEIEGFFDKSINGKPFYSFEGVPYAQPPIGELRFKEPAPVKPWDGVWKANTKYECLQYNHFSLNKNDPVDGTEDCLYVNIYTPKLGSGNLDVIIFIHGGAFIFGSGAFYQPHILLDKDVIFVTLNYRLGPLGFLSTEDDVVPGNNGLKDQILALEWIKENIQYFGGNPDSVTVTGMSAGGASVHFHMLTPKSHGLFHKAISQSGCMLNSWVLMENPLERTRELASYVGCETDSTKIMVECLRKRSSKQIVSIVGKFQPWMFNPFSPFGAVVDEWASDPVLPKHPIILMKTRKVNSVPWILSHTNDEGLYNGYDYYSDANLKHINDNWNNIIPHILHYNFTIPPGKLDEISEKIRREYIGNENLTMKNFHKLIDLMGDRLFKSDLDKCSRLQSATMESPVWYYVFNYRGAHSWSEFATGKNDNIGISHGDDTNYVIKTFVDTFSTENDRAMSKTMRDMFISFAKNGKPEINVEWISTSKNIDENIKFLHIKSPFSMINEEIEEFGNKKFWNKLPFNENEKLIRISLKDEL